MALDVPEGQVAALLRLQAGLSVGRLVPEENLHLTLAFLGDISEGQARDIAEALDALKAAPVSLVLAGLDVIGGKAPSALVVRARGEGLEALQGKVARLVRDVGVGLSRRRFRPHVTLARFGRSTGAVERRRLGEFLSLNGAFAAPKETATGVTLYRSHLRHDGAIYQPLNAVALQG